ncbi:magnesium/cobalt transporter CorA [Paenibacillus agricola]|uniref:Magnesium transport protein CorA n=1 Tax=Paenibacillus agricola TaxID=2716264 RepID=A0ABX0JBW7_9BACL|nr:magnesium/cobalt transporter CorA [Paenibacillus agricola]NHN33647.1 magnesium/cobalt transporter CorA [Paenibacillus agricola]
MIRILAINDEHEIIQTSLDNLKDSNIQWYWVDFNAPTEEEALLLQEYFHFHPLAIEDCYHLLQRPKLDHYDGTHFFVLHAMNAYTLAADEVDMFWGHNFIVTFHYSPLREIDQAWRRLVEQKKLREKGIVYIAYLIIDNLVDEYFPSLYKLEDQLDEIEIRGKSVPVHILMNEVFEIRAKLLKIRKTIVPMKELLYRVISSEKIEGLKEHMIYFADVHDHLLKLSEIIDSNRELTADIRDSYVSINSYRMNTIMKTLTVITTIFMPLTFIAGIYGMNFENMPELTWHWGYYMILLIMFSIGFGMFLWFRYKKWFD